MRRRIGALLLGMLLWNGSVNAQTATAQVNILSPVSGQVVAVSDVTIRGTVSPDVFEVHALGRIAKVAENGSFMLPVTLQEGENTFAIELYTENIWYKPQQKLSETPFSLTYKPGETTLAVPKLTFFSPEEGLKTSKDLVLFKGQADNIADLSINGKLITLTKEGRFYEKLPLPLVNTANKFVIQGVSHAGGTLQVSKSVFRVGQDAVVQEGPAPKIKVLTPGDRFESRRELVLFKGVVEHAERLYVNGKPVELDEQKRFYFKENLAVPDQYHQFEFKAISKTGRETLHSMKVFYKPKEPVLPEIVMFMPENNEVVTSTNVEVAGQATYAAFLWVNGKPVPLSRQGDFSYLLDVSGVTGPTTITITASSLNDEKTTETRVIQVKHEPKKVVTPLEKEALGIKDKAPQPVGASLKLESPDNNLITHENTIVFKGTAVGMTAVYINGDKVTLSKGAFSHKVKLDHVGGYLFNMIGVSAEGKSEPIIRKVTRVEKPKEAVAVPAAEPDLVSTLVSVEATAPSSVSSKKVVTSKSRQDVIDKLQKRISIELEGADIKDVLKILSKKSGLNIISDQSLGGYVNILLQDITIEDAITYILNTQGLSYKIQDNTILVAKASNLEIPSTLATTIFKVNNITSQAAAGILQPYLTGDEHVQFLDQDDLLVIHADPKKFRELSEIVKRLDAQEVPQVFLEVQVIESSSDALKNKGISWPSSIGLGVEATITNESYSIQSNPSFTAILNTLEENGRAKILARPRLKTINKEEAEIFIGERVPVVESTVDTTGRITESVNYVDSGILLKVLPFINPTTKEVRLKIQPEVSVISGYGGTNNDIPIIKTRKVNTTVWVKDSETVVIGGLFNSSDAKDISKLPVLGHLPILGNLLFTSKRDSDSTTELIITVTPQIVSRSGETK